MMLYNHRLYFRDAIMYQAYSCYFSLRLLGLKMITLMFCGKKKYYLIDKSTIEGVTHKLLYHIRSENLKPKQIHQHVFGCVVISLR